MKPDHIWKQLLAVFVCAVVGYVLVFGWVERRRRTNGPWQATFTNVEGLPAVVVNHPRLQLTNITIMFADAPLPTNLPQTVAFEHGRPAPFDLPFGKCVFVDAVFLPGTAAWEIFGHEIQLMPRVLTIDRIERPWRSGEKILLTNQPSATIPLIDMLLVLDNYDSFTYNLVQYLGEMNVELQVHRNDQITVEQVRALNPDRLLISPGPCSPNESGLSNEIIRTFSTHIPTLGVCLGHQCIGHVFGANVVVNYRMMHGKTSPIKHNGKDLFEGMPNPFPATRYHSLVIKRDSMPDCLEVTAETDEGEIMGVKHKQYPIWGVQFHPESILTENGRTILKNFLKLK